jgi:hypothetical protein
MRFGARSWPTPAGPLRPSGGVTFEYDIDGDAVVPRHTGYRLQRSQFEIAAGIWPVAGPGELNQIVRGPAYVYAILRDARTGLVTPLPVEARPGTYVPY